LEDQDYKNLESIISKIASENKIDDIEAVQIKLSADASIIQFKTAKPLTTEARKDLPKSEFVFPEEERYPIDTKNRAQNALARVEQHGTPEEKAAVKRKVKEKYPDMEVAK